MSLKRTGLALVAVVALIVPMHALAGPAATQEPVTADFNADFKADILYQNAGNDGLIVKLLDGSGATTLSVGLGALDSSWTLVGVSDSDDDNDSDILWQRSNGTTFHWEMQDGARVNQTNLGVIAAPDEILAYADFDMDGKADILLRNTANGAMRIRFMDGDTPIGADAPIATPLSTAWVLLGTGDFNMDMKADLYWRRASDGAVLVWLMNGATIDTNQGLGAFPPAEWIFSGSNDADGDMKSDILWRKASNDNILIHRMDGASVGSVAGIGVLPAAWIVEGFTDFSGDAKADALRRNSANGALVQWNFDAGASPVIQGSAGLGLITNPPWTILAP